MNLTEDRSSNEVDWNLLLPVRLTFRGFVRHRSCIAFSSFYEPVYGFFFKRTGFCEFMQGLDRSCSLSNKRVEEREPNDYKVRSLVQK